MNEVFTPADVQEIKDLPEELALFNPENLYVHYGFSFAELAKACQDAPQAAELPEPLKTVLHETTHLFHSITTPFGFLMYACRRLQAEMLMSAINVVRHHGIKLRYPFIDFVQELPPNVQQEVKPYIAIWYETELFILMALDSPDRWLLHMTENPIVAGLSPQILFARIQHYLAIHYREHARRLKQAQPGAGPNAPLPFADYAMDDFASPDAGRDERFLIAMQAFMENSNMIAITESAASVAEFWWNNRLDREQFFGQVRKSFERQELATSLGFLMGNLNAKRAEEYVVSYLTLCDLALFGPVLPHHRHLRKGERLIYEVLPYFRMIDLIGAAQKIPAMKSLQDRERYTEELCHMLGWVLPSQIVECATKDHAAMEGDNLEIVYLLAAHHRKAKPWIFQDYSFLLAGSGDSHRQFLLDFNFPVIQYRDQTVYTMNKPLLITLVRFQMVRSALRAILFKDRLALKMPYRPKNAEEVAFLRETLVQDLESAIGVRVNDLTLA